MHVNDVFRIAGKNVHSNSVRTWLTILSISIGVSSVMLIVSMSVSGEALISNELDKLGIQGITLYSNNIEQYPLKKYDAEYIRDSISEISYAVPIAVEYGSYRIKNEQGNAVFWGVGEDANKVINLDLKHGRIFNEADVRFEKNVAVIDLELAKKIYGRENITGKEIVLSFGEDSEKFKIIGIISSQKDGINQISGGIIPDFIYLPYTTVNRICATEDVDQIALKCMNGFSSEKVGNKAKKLLNRKNNTVDVFSVENLTGHIDNLKSITGIVGLILSVIAAISLLVSGLGIMNTVLSSAKERKKEIGICIAIGATGKDIMTCFLAESAIIAAIGGIIGGTTGLGISIGILSVLNMPFSFSMKNIVIIEAVAVFTGILFSILPAKKATKLNPIVALREE